MAEGRSAGSPAQHDSASSLEGVGCSRHDHTGGEGGAAGMTMRGRGGGAAVMTIQEREGGGGSRHDHTG